jgi:hypothetical protein
VKIWDFIKSALSILTWGKFKNVSRETSLNYNSQLPIVGLFPTSSLAYNEQLDLVTSELHESLSVPQELLVGQVGQESSTSEQSLGVQSQITEQRNYYTPPPIDSASHVLSTHVRPAHDWPPWQRQPAMQELVGPATQEQIGQFQTQYGFGTNFSTDFFSLYDDALSLDYYGVTHYPFSLPIEEPDPITPLESHNSRMIDI